MTRPRKSRVEAIFADYLSELRLLSAELAPTERAELLGAIEEHIAHVRSSTNVTDEAGARALLARLGSPDSIVDEVYGRKTRPGRTVDLKPERNALLWISLGSLLPVFGWLRGVSAVWESARFSRAEKWAATLLVPGGLLAALAFTFWIGAATDVVCSSDYAGTVGAGGVRTVLSTSSSCTDPLVSPPIGFGLAVAVLLVAVLGPLWVWRSVRSRTCSPDTPHLIVV
ncbi:MAG TPA: hypothetical protein VK816_00335 [Jatrophihabitantaceae bacterium]|jgi:hypothetical protein|nr:hypothetical protein [Jatrophihabitantaceae bacterium]